MAKASFGASVQFWDEIDDQLGFYDWASIHASIKSYMQGTSESEFPLPDSITSAQYPKGTDLYKVVEIAGHREHATTFSSRHGRQGAQNIVQK
ncbi:hypothetical protein SUNI508_00422 [Seiridium unicorne]|uniref:Uncharacterized protein n=1 Tax=Seiridium unicorne TaxID=138068 RepID=A0ABR2V6U7_9PEZI